MWILRSMAYRPLEVTLISAKDLSNVNLFSKMEVYAMAMLAGDTRSRKKTVVDREGRKNPTWNATVKFNVMEYDADRAVLHIVLKSERALGDREIGEVHVPIRELLDGRNRAAAAGGSSSGGAADKKAAPLPNSSAIRSARTWARPRVSSTSPTNSAETSSSSAAAAPTPKDCI